MWFDRTPLLYQFADFARNKESLDSCVRLLFEGSEFSLVHFNATGTQDAPIVTFTLETPFTPQRLVAQKPELTCGNICQIPLQSACDDAGGCFLMAFKGRNEIAYILRALDSREIEGYEQAADIRDNLSHMLGVLPKGARPFVVAPKI